MSLQIPRKERILRTREAGYDHNILAKTVAICNLLTTSADWAGRSYGLDKLIELSNILDKLLPTVEVLLPKIEE